MHQPEQLVALYTPDALLLGTSSATLYVGIEAIRTYFKGSATVVFGTQHVVPLAEDSVLAVGKYVFTQTREGQSVVVPARFTFVLRQTADGWRVLHHHSSADPA